MEKKEPSVQIILAEHLSIKEREIAMRYWKQNHGVFEKPSKIAKHYGLRTIEVTRIGRKVGILKISKACKKCHIQRQYKTDSQAKAKRILAPLWICDVCTSSQQNEGGMAEKTETTQDFSLKESDYFYDANITADKKELCEKPFDVQLISELENALKTNLRLLKLLKRSYLIKDNSAKDGIIIRLKRKLDNHYIDEPHYSGEICFNEDYLIKANTKYSYEVYHIIGDDLSFQLFPKKSDS
ncbi:hypothetical protein [Zobellia russellii]|uniref:hypothetical protein n=1 Tax=Zobellia russellii TaxID=248907 RepID=UPI001BFF5FC2|nr:hypothetical protein [Zobellia russellii]MBT9187765.1 hypothetical protein [Zobellia russellii]